jgi:hypothetical protein
MAPALSFSVLEAAPLRHAAAPTLRFTLEVTSDEPIRSVLLDTQLRIAARRRGYGDEDVARLFELFGAKRDWGSTLRSLLWTHGTLVIPPFEREARADLDIPCSYDLEVVASRYFDALGDGDVPLEFLFSGSVFYVGAAGSLQVERISWEQEAEFRLPVAVWKETMDRHFRGTAWLRLSKESFDRLAAYKARHALPSWEAALDALLVDPKEPAWIP